MIQNNIIGHEDILNYINKIIVNDKVSQAYIIDGDYGVGRKTIAKYFVAALNCLSDNKPCFSCKNCKSIMSDNSNDVRYITSLLINDMRKDLVEDISIKPYLFKYKIYIILDADLLSEASQNVLLKCIENPPKYAKIIFITNNYKKLLKTIVSRCILLKLQKVNIDSIKKYLIDNFNIEEKEASIFANFSNGCIGKAIDIYKNDKFINMINNIMYIIKNIHNMNIKDIIKYLKDIEKNYKDNINEYLNYFFIFYRDLLIFKLIKDLNFIIFKNEIEYIKEYSNNISCEKIKTILDYIIKTKERIKNNVNFYLTIKLLFLEIIGN